MRTIATVASVVPVWAQIIIAGAALVGALGVLWAKVVRPGARLITNAEEMLPMLEDLPILREIIAQLRTDSGSSLRDIIERLEAKADAVEAASKGLAIAVAVVKELAAEDRKLSRDDRATLAKLVVFAEMSGASNLRTEAAAAGVAEDLAAAQGRAHEVDIEEPPGAAADAASRPESGEPTERSTLERPS